jgi:hypothetical protein
VLAANRGGGQPWWRGIIAPKKRGFAALAYGF